MRFLRRGPSRVETSGFLVLEQLRKTHSISWSDFSNFFSVTRLVIDEYYEYEYLNNIGCPFNYVTPCWNTSCCHCLEVLQSGGMFIARRGWFCALSLETISFSGVRTINMDRTQYYMYCRLNVSDQVERWDHEVYIVWLENDIRSIGACTLYASCYFASIGWRSYTWVSSTQLFDAYG